MVNARSYTPNDFNMINKWFKDRTNNELDEEILPKIGFLVDDIACGFVYRTNSRVAFLDFFISNSSKSSSERKIAIQLVTDKILDACKKMKIKLLICNTKIETIMDYAIANGFRYDGLYSTFSRRL